MTAKETKKIPVWVRIPRLPIELYNKMFLERMGASLGTMLKIDRLTSIHSRGEICKNMCGNRPREVGMAKKPVPAGICG